MTRVGYHPVISNGRRVMRFMVPQQDRYVWSDKHEAFIDTQPPCKMRVVSTIVNQH